MREIDWKVKRERERERERDKDLMKKEMWRRGGWEKESRTVKKWLKKKRKKDEEREKDEERKKDKEREKGEEREKERKRNKWKENDEEGKMKKNQRFFEMVKEMTDGWVSLIQWANYFRCWWVWFWSPIWRQDNRWHWVGYKDKRRLGRLDKVRTSPFCMLSFFLETPNSQLALHLWVQ